MQNKAETEKKADIEKQKREPRNKSGYRKIKEETEN